jgi:hypothetical protein
MPRIIYRDPGKCDGSGVEKRLQIPIAKIRRISQLRSFLQQMGYWKGCKNFCSKIFCSPRISAWCQAFQDKNLIFKANVMEQGHTKDIGARRDISMAMKLIKYWLLWLTLDKSL